MSMKQVGTAVLNPGAPDEVWGYCETQDITHEADKEQIKDGQGDTKGVLFTDIRQKVDGTYTPLAAAGANDPPNLGADDLIGRSIAMGSMTIIVETATFKRKKGGVSEFSISGYRYPNLVTSGAVVTSGGQV